MSFRGDMAGRLGEWRALMADYYARLEVHEQRLLWIAAVVVPLSLYLFALVLPLHEAKVRLQLSMPTLEVQQQEARLLAEQLQGQGGTERFSGDLLRMVEKVAADSGIRGYITRLKPQDESGGQRLLVGMHKAPYPELVRFLAAIADESAGVEQARLRVVADGVLDVELVLAGG